MGSLRTLRHKLTVKTANPTEPDNNSKHCLGHNPRCLCLEKGIDQFFPECLLCDDELSCEKETTKRIQKEMF
jgi:hypothetical protein